jgi:putative DNA primase/helicase
LRWTGISWPPKKGKHIHCPFPGHEDKNPSWRWDSKNGAWFCSKCGGGDVLHTVQRMKGLSFVEALDLIETQFLGEAPATKENSFVTGARRHSGAPGDASQHAEQDLRQKTGNASADETVTAEEQAEKARQRALKLWMEALAVAGTPAQTYFEQFRGIVLDWPGLHNSTALSSATLVQRARRPLPRYPLPRIGSL